VKGNSPNDVKLCLLMILRLQLEATITPVGRSFQLVHQSMSTGDDNYLGESSILSICRFLENQNSTSSNNVLL
jgi:hypothetical protein